MNPTRKKAFFAAAAVLGLFVLITTVRLWKYSSIQHRCDSAASPDRLRELGVDVPSNVQLCREREATYGAMYYVLLSRASPVCVASMGAVGCSSARQEGLRWTMDMTRRGWGTGRVGRAEGSSLVYELERPDTTVTLSLYEDQFHEVTGLLQVAMSGGTGRRASR